MKLPMKRPHITCLRVFNVATAGFSVKPEEVVEFLRKAPLIAKATEHRIYTFEENERLFVDSLGLLQPGDFPDEE